MPVFFIHLKRLSFDAEGTVLVIANVTQLRLAQIQMQQQQKLESIGVLTSGVAHDFNNCLAIISASHERLEMEGVVNKHLGFAQVAARRAMDVVSQLLIFSAQTDHTLTEVNTQDILQEVIKLVPLIMDRNFEVRLIVEGDFIILCEESLLQNALVNLMMNAYHASPENRLGVLTITQRKATQKELNKLDTNYDTAVVIEYRDNGRGIPDTIVDKIFEPFFTTRTAGQGTGLGLSVVYGFVIKLGGVISYTRVQPSGACFKLVLPAKESITQESVDKDLEGSFAVMKGSVLLVDDEAVLAQIISASLELQGLIVTTVNSVSEACALLDSAHRPFDVIISDLRLLDGDGLDVLRKARQMGWKSRGILISGFADYPPSYEKELTFKFLQKPFSLKVLNECLSEEIEILNSELLTH